MLWQLFNCLKGMVLSIVGQNAEFIPVLHNLSGSMLYPSGKMPEKYSQKKRLGMSFTPTLKPNLK